MNPRESAKEQRKKIALERIEILRGMMSKKPEYKQRYEELIKRLAQKYRIR